MYECGVHMWICKQMWRCACVCVCVFPDAALEQASSIKEKAGLYAVENSLAAGNLLGG